MDYDPIQIKITMPVLDFGGYVDWQSDGKGTIVFKSEQDLNKYLKEIDNIREIKMYKVYKSSNSIKIYT